MFRWFQSLEHNRLPIQRNGFLSSADTPHEVQSCSDCAVIKQLKASRPQQPSLPADGLRGQRESRTVRVGVEQRSREWEGAAI